MNNTETNMEKLSNNSDIISDDNNNKYDYRNNKKVRKIGKTLLIILLNNATFDENDLTDVNGIVNKSDLKNNGLFFLIFDTPANALNGLKILKNKSANYKIKFSYYKLFFTINGLNDNSSYDDTKKALINHIQNLTNSNVLYCKLYCKDKKYLGCGDVTLDTLDGINMLLSKDNGLKSFSIESPSISGTFFRFNSKNQNQTQTQTQTQYQNQNQNQYQYQNQNQNQY